MINFGVYFAKVEEEVLESLVWTSDSPLWEQLSKTDVPASAGVSVHESPLRRINSKFNMLRLMETLVRVLVSNYLPKILMFSRAG